MLRMQLKRCYKIPSKSYFLLGPRGVGKSTWIKSGAKYKLAIDLLEQKTFLELQREPSRLEAKASPLEEGETVFIDEIQRLPDLLNEVHRLMESHKLNFILTGSSARKLRRSGANLLGGRAHTYHMYPFSFSELGKKYKLDDALISGTLPIVIRNPKLAEETLNSYVETYLREEVKEEALVRRMDEFARFLTIAGQLNAQVLNFENVGRETGKSSNTVQNWYQILEETLLGSFLKPYRPGFKVREIGHPKYYWFDPGVARVSAGMENSSIDSLWKGFAFETLVLNEMRIYMEVSRKRYGIFYYGTPGSGEIDFLIETRPKTMNRKPEFVTVEVKHSAKWKREFETPSRQLKAVAKDSHKRMLAVYLGNEALRFDKFDVLPFSIFIEHLFGGKIF